MRPSIKNRFQIALLLGAIFLFNNLLFAQKDDLELLPGSEKFVYDEQTGKHRLLGTVNFRYQGNTMYCDSAIYWEKSKEVVAYGKVHILKDGVNLFCDSLYYNGNTKIAKLWGNVRVRDNEYKLLTDSLEYDTKKDVGIYRNGGKIERITDNEILLSKVGYIYTKSKNMFYSGNVKYYSKKLNMFTDTLRYDYKKNTTYFFGPTDILKFDDSSKVEAKIYCEKGWYQTITDEAQLEKRAEVKGKSKYLAGDLLYYNPKKGISKGRGNVHFFDTIQQAGFQSNYFLGNEKESVYFLADKALLKKVNKLDTFYVHADSMFVYLDSLTNKLEMVNAYHDVKFFKDDVQGKCDSLTYVKSDSLMQLFYDPIVWVKNKIELKGDKIELQIIGDSIIDHAKIYNNSTILMEVDSGAYYNQITGKQIDAYFEKNDLYRADVQGNAITIYYPENKDKETDTSVVIKRLGMNRIYASDLRIYIDSNEVKGVTYFEQPEGKFYPIEKINKDEQFIKNFKWKIALKPKRWQDLIED